jgi:hypothetical protein
MQTILLLVYNLLFSQYVKELFLYYRFEDVLDLNQMIHQNESHLILITKVEDIGVEPMTLCVQGRCSSQLS